MSLASKEKGMDQVTLEKASLQFPLELPSLKSKENGEELKFCSRKGKEKKATAKRERRESLINFLPFPSQQNINLLTITLGPWWPLDQIV